MDIRPDIRQHPAGIRYPATTGYPDPAFHLPDYPVSGRKSISGPTLAGTHEALGGLSISQSCYLFTLA